MNGNENGYAWAIFFGLISMGAAMKIEEMIMGLAISGGGALLAAISLRRGLNGSAQAAEEDHQRMEIQFQQLRAKIVETSTASIEAMNSLSEVSQLLRDNLKIMREQSATMEDLISLIKNAESVNSLVASLEENSAAQNAALEKIFDAIQSQEVRNAESINSLIGSLEENSLTQNAVLEKISAALQSNTDELKKFAAAQSHQISYAKDFEKINAALEKLGASENSAANKNLSALIKINDTLSKNLALILDNLRLEVSRLSDKIEMGNGAPREDKTPLTAQDVDLLKKIVAKIDLK